MRTKPGPPLPQISTEKTKCKTCMRENGHISANMGTEALVAN